MSPMGFLVFGENRRRRASSACARPRPGRDHRRCRAARCCRRHRAGYRPSGAVHGLFPAAGVRRARTGASRLPAIVNPAALVRAMVIEHCWYSVSMDRDSKRRQPPAPSWRDFGTSSHFMASDRPYVIAVRRHRLQVGLHFLQAALLSDFTPPAAWPLGGLPRSPAWRPLSIKLFVSLFRHPIVSCLSAGS